MIVILLFILGLCVGSFLNVVIDRIPHGMSIVKGRSQCDFCLHPLCWYDLVPLFSYAFLLGKCRYCGASLSLQYPLIELLTGCLFVLLYVLLPHQTSIDFIKLFLSLSIISSAVALFVMDLKYTILSDGVMLFMTLCSIMLILLIDPHNMLQKIAIGIFTVVPFFLIFFFSKGRGMGFGDVKLAFVMGFLLGFPQIVVALYVAFLTGGIASIILVLRGKKKFKGGTIPFGPFLLLGTFLAFLWGQQLWIFFLRLLGA